jgi:hypothetical protein
MLDIARWMLPVVVVHVVGEPKEPTEPSPARQTLGGSELPRVGIQNDVRIPVGTERQQAHEAIGAIHQLMSSSLSARKRAYLPLIELTPSIGTAQTWASLQDHHQLLLGEVVVIWVGRLARRNLPDTDTEAFRLQLVTYARASNAKPLLFARLVEVRVVEVWHESILLA